MKSSNAAAASNENESTGEPTGVMAAVLQRLPTAGDVRARFGDLWTKSRPWAEFFNTAAMNKPEMPELRERISQNLQYYAYNYATVFAVLVVFMVLVSPLSILGALAIFALYTYLFVLHPDPWVALGERLTIDNRAKSGIILVFSLVVLWLTGAGATFTSLLAVVGVIALGHAAIRKPPGEADFETAFQPA
ncbi:hypothetical protein CDCA_CDCA08G2332 [Cyanidium caldarium]|uniref:PRA1 family protein n=1 Tax=Cyanidium caldarium TaxID=2771 RepID=A0AAV9IVE2_CYACA|nr:hypothetical protein CDCA_CDCA08G2332 [Cyanidium caldarium]